MKIYICDETCEPYSAGLLIIAANSLEEAIKVVTNYNGDNDYYRFKEQAVKESPLLTANVDKAQIIHSMSYFE